MTAADAKAALERGRPVVLVRPPAVEQARDLWEILGPLTPGSGPGVGPAALIICADDAAAGDWVSAPPAGMRVHAVTGLARSAQLLRQGLVHVLAGGAKDLGALVERAVLKLERVSTVVIAWPETSLAGDHAATLDALLAEARDARRVVLSWNPTLIADFLERHARRAEIVGAPGVDESGRPLPPVCRARYAIVPSHRRSVAVLDALDALSATKPFVWNGGPIAPTAEAHPDAVLCTTLPTREELTALARVGEPLLLLSAAQVPYSRAIATLTPLVLASGADRARDRVEALRGRVAERLEAGTVDAELALLDPLFQRFDPAEVAAALLALLGEGGRREKEEEAAAPLPADARVKVFVNVGKKDRASAKDLVGALIREAGLTKNDIGRIEVRDSFSLVELAPPAAQQAVQKLAGATIRGRRMAPRLDRNT
ncbi:MAG TPA: DbpA RNA binding domain-containing protein [Gemmatimonadales bacterium]|nr:DbpA RNA binding domain-containing protein [Gemmatimonadales bacterium]